MMRLLTPHSETGRVGEPGHESFGCIMRRHLPDLGHLAESHAADAAVVAVGPGHSLHLDGDEAGVTEAGRRPAIDEDAILVSIVIHQGVIRCIVVHSHGGILRCWTGVSPGCQKPQSQEIDGEHGGFEVGAEERLVEIVILVEELGQFTR